jgi:1,4-dihydroxy-2-naphthoate polyprenyltransferase
MLNAALITMGIAFISGLYLVWIGGWVIFWIGVFSIIFGILYTAGPFPLGYNGLGDIFVFLFFGLIAVTGTYYINALGWSFEAVLLSIPVGALCVNILVVNNLRDINQDRITGKKTLGVLFGEFVLKAEYTGMILIAYSSLFVLFIYFEYTRAIFLPLLVFPIVLWQLRTVWGHDDKTVLNHTLERTAQFMVFFGILLSVSVLLQSA